ncbi:MAG TPA: metallophosphoesterase family protein [Pyrinomonadaceae bacterium]|jgi:3',5'-cyclic AMP phosphodiesterase CpdA
MRTLVHLSDLHFGRLDERVVEPLRAQVEASAPDVIAVSGDLTQRARSEQFKAARAFLDTLPRVPLVVVPGNHDVPLYNVWARFAQPLEKYRRYVTPDLEPFYADKEIAVLGLNTARSFTRKSGRVNRLQMARIRERLCPHGDEITKVIVTHHPFDVPPGADEREVVGRARQAMETLAACGADVLLAGHLHVSHTGQTAKRYRIRGHSALVVQAGTATSTRGRGEANSFNVLRLKHPYINVQRFAWAEAQRHFALASSEHFRHTPDGWVRLSDEVAAGLTYTAPGDALQPHVPA